MKTKIFKKKNSFLEFYVILKRKLSMTIVIIRLVIDYRKQLFLNSIRYNEKIYYLSAPPGVLDNKIKIFAVINKTIII
jgi:hypothetical protein